MNHIIANWPAPATVHALCTTRLGPGHSKAPFDQANFGLNTGDKIDAVHANRAELTQQLALPSPPLWLKQAHGTQSIEHHQQRMLIEPTADASFTHHKHQVLAILTADCVPIMLTDTKGSFVAAIHAGWRGLHQSIIENTLSKIKPTNPVIAWIGPCIRPPHYTVNLSFKKQFLEKNVAFEIAFNETPNKIVANLPMIARLQLEKVGVKSIIDSELCTYSDPGRFYSYRRDKENSGRVATLIWMTEP